MPTNKKASAGLDRDSRHELLKPTPLQAKYEIEIEVLQGCRFINLLLRFIRHAAMGGSFQIKPPMYSVFRAKQVGHDNEPGLDFNRTGSKYLMPGLFKDLIMG